MAQFRNSLDILTEVLQKSGEPTNGNSPYQTRAMTYLNKVHHAIVGGGNVFNVNVDEPWVWARAHFPIVIEMQPAFTSGYVTTINGSNNLVFQLAPTYSIEGWHFQVNGKSTVYKIMQHAAGSTSAQIDSSFVDDPGLYSFRCFKLDYPVFPAYMYIDNSNDRLDFQEIDTAASTTTTHVASLAHGAYTPTNLFATLVATLGTTGTASYGGGYDTVAGTFNLTGSATGGFTLLGASGASTRRSALPTLGFDVLDQTGAKSYTSTYMPNQVARLIEPFKMFMVNWWGENFCYSTDPIKMQEDYPVALITERFPDRFCRISEDNNGVIWVRFNAYPKQTTKLQIDWIPQPIDLQNNTASFTKLPRGDVDTLIHGATAYLLLDKEDSKQPAMQTLCKDGLDAMKKKNHNLLFRTGQRFGQIVPRQDLDRAVRHLNYGYTVSGSTAAVTVASTLASFNESFGYQQFQSAGTQTSVTIQVLPANMTLFSLILKHSVAWAGTGIATLSMDVGTATNPTQFVNGFNPAQSTAATAQASLLTNYFPAVATNIQVRLTSTGANLSNLTAGAANCYLQELLTQ